MDSPAPLMAECIDYDALCAGFETWKGRGADGNARVGVWIAKTFRICGETLWSLSNFERKSREIYLL